MTIRLFTLFLMLVPAAAFASVGKVSLLDGKATRKAASGRAMALAVGTSIEVGDTLEVSQGNLKILLQDSSTLALPEGSRLHLDAAQFEGEERKGVTLKLLVGSVWAAVTQAMEGDAPFEVQTERASAGVRGTILEVQALPTGEASVYVEEGEVDLKGGPNGATSQRVEAGQAVRVQRTGLFERTAPPRRAAAFERFLSALRDEHHRFQRVRETRRDERRRRHEQELREHRRGTPFPASGQKLRDRQKDRRRHR